MSSIGLTEPLRRVQNLVELLPLASTAELAAIDGVTESLVHNRLRTLHGLGKVESHALGCAAQRIERQSLCLATQQERGLDYASWHQPGALIQLLERLPTVSPIYHMVASISDLGRITDFQWFSHDTLAGGAMDAAVRYEQGWVAMMYFGSLRTEGEITSSFQAMGTQVAALGIGDPFPRPALVAVAAADKWTAMLVARVVCRHRFDDWVRIYCVDERRWYTAPPPSSSRGWVYQPVYRRQETIHTWHTRLRRSPWASECMREPVHLLRLARPRLRQVLDREGCARLFRRLESLLRQTVNLAEAARLIREHGVAPYAEGAAAEEVGAIMRRLAAALESPVSVADIDRILGTVIEWPGITTAMLRLKLGEGTAGRRAQHASAFLVDIGLLLPWADASHSARMVRRFRPSDDCITLYARGNRMTKGTLETRFRLKDWSSPDDIEEHEYGLLNLVADFMEARFPVINGRREYQDMGEAGAIVPDATVYLSEGFFGAGWYYIEYELSARAVARIEEKLCGYASPCRRNAWPLLVVCRGGNAERNFWKVGQKLGIASMFTTTLVRLRRGGAMGNGTWSLFGRPVQLIDNNAV